MSLKTKWTIDPMHTDIAFKVKHMMFTNVTGRIIKYKAAVETNGNDFVNADVQFTGETASITTGTADRDAHILGPDFFDAAQFPDIAFVATSIKATSDNQLLIEGNLTIHGQVKKVVLNGQFGGVVKDPVGNIRALLSLTGSINRKDWGLTWNAALETGGVLIGETVNLVAEIQLLKQK